MEVHEIRISEQKVFEDGLAFPLVLSPTHLEGATAQDAARYVEANKATLDEKCSYFFLHFHLHRCM